MQTTFFRCILLAIAFSVTSGFNFEQQVGSNWVAVQGTLDSSADNNVLTLGTQTVKFDTIVQVGDASAGITSIEITPIDGGTSIVLRDPASSAGEVAKFIDAVATVGPLDMETLLAHADVVSSAVQKQFADAKIADIEFQQIDNAKFEFVVSLDASQTSTTLTTQDKLTTQAKQISDYFTSLKDAQVDSATITLRVVESLGADFYGLSPALMDIKADILEGEKRQHHRRRHHHSKHRHREDRLDNDDFVAHRHMHHEKFVTGRYGDPKGNSLQGGVSIGFGDGSATLGGIAVLTKSPFTKYAITNNHVNGVSNGKTICQPAPSVWLIDHPKDINHCEELGARVVGDGGEAVNGAASGETKDWALVAVGDRVVKCDMLGIGAVTGKQDATAWAKVQKYGARTGLTTGYVTSVHKSDMLFGADYRIEGIGLPTFADMNPDNSDSLTRAGNDPDFVDSIKADLRRRIAVNFKRVDGTPYSDDELDQISEKIVEEKLVRSIFATKGDSGAWIMLGTKATGLLVGGEWVMDSRETAQSKDIVDRKWNYFDNVSFAYKMTRVVSSINSLLKDTSIDVCVNGGVPPVTADDCYWGYSTRRCEPAQYCIYKYKFALNPTFWHLGYSCTLRT